MLKKYLILFLTLLPALAIAQITKVSGTVIDAKTKETLPYATVSIVGTKLVGISDKDGKYTVIDSKPFNLIRVSCVGYIPLELPVIAGKNQLIDIFLRKCDYLFLFRGAAVIVLRQFLIQVNWQQ